jgi:hypothetical protein
MSTTTTDQGVRCGNHGRDRVYHADRNAVRACFQGRTATPPPSSQPANADEARSESMKRLASQTSPFFPRGEAPRVYPASLKAVAFFKDLAAEVLVGEAQVRALAMADNLSSAEAKRMIDDMLVMRTSQRAMAANTPAASAPSSWSTMINELMGNRSERNFCIIDEEGKARFYRVSKRGSRSRRPGTWKIQERVSDSLFPRYDSMLTSVVAAIMAQGGAEAAGRRFAELMHRCYECGASLTDTTGNPYYSIGLGPECGSK